MRRHRARRQTATIGGERRRRASRGVDDGDEDVVVDAEDGDDARAFDRRDVDRGDEEEDGESDATEETGGGDDDRRDDDREQDDRRDDGACVARVRASRARS